MFLDVTRYWRIDIGQIALNGIRVIVAFILMCKSFWVPSSLELFSRFFYIKLVRDRSEWHTFQRKSGAVKLVKKLPQSIYGWKKQGFYVFTDGPERPWNRMKKISNLSIDSKHMLIEDSIKTIQRYSFGMLFGEGN